MNVLLRVLLIESLISNGRNLCSLIGIISSLNRNFNSALDLGCGRGLTASELTKDIVKRIMMIDSSARMLDQIRPPIESNGHDGIEIIKKQMDEEHLTGEPSSFDLVYSCLSLHWINDLPGVFRRVLSLMKNDAPFIGKFPKGMWIILMFF